MFGNTVVTTIQFSAIFTALPYLVDYYGTTDELRDATIMETWELHTNQTQTFDFIVIGAGSAGSVVANRLSKDYKVLLIEAGGNPNPVMQTPGFYLLQKDSIDYQYETVSQKNNCCLALIDQKIKVPRGKGLGGSSNVNAMHYHRGSKGDFDNWAQITNDSNWSWENVLKYFKKSEDYHGSHQSNEFHGIGNELYVGKLGHESVAAKYFFETLKSKGIRVGDLNSMKLTNGFMAPEVSTKNGKRWGSYEAFINPILNRTNLKILRYAKATKIHFDENKKAVGVTYSRHGLTNYVSVSKEIILSAGTIDSPKLLMLSGIFPSEHLNSPGVEQVLNLPVGQNLMDHLSTYLHFTLNDGYSYLRSRDESPETFLEYYKNGTGPLSTVNNQVAMGLLTSSEMINSSWPDLYYLVLNGGIESNFGKLAAGFQGGKLDIFEKFYAPIEGKDVLTVLAGLARPKSKGQLTLRSSNPNDAPLIDLNLLDDVSDLPRMVEGIQLIVNLLESESLKEIGLKVQSNSFPGCENIEFNTAKYWECYVRHFTSSLYHPVGTCRMGNGVRDSKAVVNSKLQVLHTSGLRVIDASVMPEIVTGNTNAATVMIGEMGSDFILQDWKN